jgi:hypothetical protein
MALRTFTFTTFTPTNTADTSTMANATYMAMKGGSGTQRWAIEELYMGGQASASSINDMVLALHSTIAVTPTALAAPAADRPLDGSASTLATVVVTFTAASTGPQRLTQGYLLTPSYNAFGGIVRLNYSNTQARPVGLGNTASLGEMSLSAKNDTGTSGAMSAHILYEPF